MTIRLSIAILTHDEVTEFGWLMEVLAALDRRRTEVVVVDDHSGPAMQALLARHATRVAHRALGGDFAAQRNYLTSQCRGEFVLMLDPDEIPSPGLLANLFGLCDALEANRFLACALPRLNILHEGTEPVDARTLSLSDADFQGVDPDYQTRLFRNVPELRWQNRVHERLVGMQQIHRLPVALDCALLHVKARQRQLRQNAFYDVLARYTLRQWAKRLGLRPLAVALGLLKEPVPVPLRLK